MALQYRTRGFVYKKKDRGEADRIFTVFTYDFGKLDIFAKAIRKINSKLKSGIDMFYLSEIEFVQGKKKTLTDAAVINKFGGIINNPEKFTVSQKISKVLEAFIKGQEHDHEIFDLIIETFKKLDACEVQAKTCQLIFIYFIWNFFAVLGYSPQLLNCAHCHGALNEKELYFSDKDGGVICKNCLPREALAKWGIKKTNSDVIKTLRIILKKDWETLLKLKIEKPARNASHSDAGGENFKTLKEISKNYYLYLLASHSFSK